MNIHIHIPKLLDFAAYTACDDVVRIGARRLIVPMVDLANGKVTEVFMHALYLKCMQVFAQKHRDPLNARYTNVMSLYHHLRCGNTVDLSDDDERVVINFVAADFEFHVSLFDHIVLLDGRGGVVQRNSQNLVLKQVVWQPYFNVNAAMSCMHRFAARCMASHKHDVMTSIMSRALTICAHVSVRDVLLHYGGRLDPNDVLSICGTGMYELVQQAISRGIRIQALDLRSSILCGDLETVKLIANVIPQNDRQVPDVISWLPVQVTVSYCNSLLELGILDRNHKYELNGVSSLVALRWLISHDMVDYNGAVGYACSMSAVYGGQYLDVLHYLIDELHQPLPDDDDHYLSIPFINIGLIDYLMHHGLNVNVRDGCSVVYERPEYLRYWNDHDALKGVKSVKNLEVFGFNFLDACIVCYMDIEAIVIYVEMISLDIDAICRMHDKRGRTLLFTACRQKASATNPRDFDLDCRFIDYLIQHGGDVYTRDVDGQTAYDIADDGLKQYLKSKGFDVNYEQRTKESQGSAQGSQN